MPDSWDYSQRPRAADHGPHAPVLTWTVVALCVVFTLAYHTSARTQSPLWYQLGHWSVLPAEAIWSGHYGALLTAVFVHGGLLHIGFNMLWLIQLGGILEATIGPAAWLAFFVGAGIAGAGSELAFGGQTGVGASGVVYAMFGLMWAGRRQYPAWQLVATPQNLRLFVGWGVFCFVATWLHIMSIANFAHAGGFLFGLAVGWLFVERRHRAWAGLSLALLAAVTVISVLWLPWSGDWLLWRAQRELGARRYDTAIAYLKRSMRWGVDRAQAWYAIAMIEQERSNLPAAEQAEREADKAALEAARPSRGPDVGPDTQ